MNRLLAFVLAVAVVLGAHARALAAAPPSYAYDAFAPLDLSIDDSNDVGNVRVASLTYRSQSTLVHAVLVSPTRLVPGMPGVLFAHWLGDPATTDHTEFLEDAKWLARRGVVSLLPDEPWSQPDWFEQVRAFATDDRDSIATVIALRRGLDVLAGRDGVDKTRLAFVGHDFGAMYGALLASVDPRPTAYVFDAPTSSLAEWFELDTARLPSDRAAYEAKMSAFDLPSALARATFRSALVQFGTHDRYVSGAHARAFADAVLGADKTVRFYDAGHDLGTPAVADDRRAWLAAHLIR